MNLFPAITVFFIAGSIADASDINSLRADRSAIERVYYSHRLGVKSTFDDALPPEALEKLIRRDLQNEATLKKVYGIAITPALLEVEVQRINTTTHAPEMLAEIKAALGNDPSRFANSFAKPILVEKILREKFDNDDALHSPQRREMEEARRKLLSAKSNGADYAGLLALLKRGQAGTVAETTWQMTPRPGETPGAESAEEIEIRKRFGPQAQLLSPPRENNGRERKFYLSDLPGELQNVLRVQLRQAGDVSAVIEMPAGFVIYVAREKTDDALSVACLSIPKRAYEQWLEEQPASNP